MSFQCHGLFAALRSNSAKSVQCFRMRSTTLSGGWAASFQPMDDSRLWSLSNHNRQEQRRSLSSIQKQMPHSQDRFRSAVHRIEKREGSAKKRRGVRDVGSDDDFASASAIMTSHILESQPLRATAFSTAERYDFAKLLPILQRRLILLPYIADDVFHVQITHTSWHPSSQAESAQQSSQHSQSLESYQSSPSAASSSVAPAEAFFFRNGTFVTWGATDDEIQELIEIVTDVSIMPYSAVESEWFDYHTDPNQQTGMSADIIIVGYDVPAHQAKLAFSSGLARAAKLSSLENLLDAHIDKNRDIPQALLSGKQLPIGRKAVLRNLGELFSLRGHVNLHSELLDSPEFCWSSSKMEELFNRISRNLDVKPRIAVFNRKVDYANEIAELLRNHLHEEHSHKLEWIIIILIMIEVGFEVLHFLKQ